mmetsp:Transcript_19319/g.50227  ORF Transcript_19319/g.50227 Transcript_19319/m.50227 type:complete len:258 (-) Transcript_19319:36-809(-)
MLYLLLPPQPAPSCLGLHPRLEVRLRSAGVLAAGLEEVDRLRAGPERLVKGVDFGESRDGGVAPGDVSDELEEVPQLDLADGDARGGEAVGVGLEGLDLGQVVLDRKLGVVRPGIRAGPEGLGLFGRHTELRVFGSRVLSHLLVQVLGHVEQLLREDKLDGGCAVQGGHNRAEVVENRHLLADGANSGNLYDREALPRQCRLDLAPVCHELAFPLQSRVVQREPDQRAAGKDVEVRGNNRAVRGSRLRVCCCCHRAH